MDDYHKFLKKLDSSPQSKRQEPTFKPRKFPKKQYHRLNIRYALASIIIVIILIAGGGFYCANNYFSAPSSHLIDHRSSQSMKSSNQPPRHKSGSQKKISVLAGERLMGRWIRRMNYPNGQIILKKYEQLSPQQAQSIGNQIQTINQSTKSYNQKETAIKKILTKVDA